MERIDELRYWVELAAASNKTWERFYESCLAPIWDCDFHVNSQAVD